jgi:nicotinic acetylcholine receptor, invertebrate
MKALTNIKYLNNRMKKDNLDLEIIEDWKFVSMVVDRMLLLVFGVTFFVGTVGILMQAPSIYDKRDAITRFNFKKIK